MGKNEKKNPVYVNAFCHGLLGAIPTEQNGRGETCRWSQVAYHSIQAK